MGVHSTSLRQSQLSQSRASLRKGPSASYLEGSGDCIIDEAHMRGVTLHQLRKVAEYTWECCQWESRASAHMQNGLGRRLSWLRRSSTAPEKSFKLLPSEINLYEIVEKVVKPLTRQKERSYVEFASWNPNEQVPCWFVSHYWGEPVESFMECLQLFHRRHALTDTTPFWICAYALRQHQLDKEIGRGDPTQEAFAKAIKSDNILGTVTILDEELEAYKRAWCCFEATVTIGMGKRLDLVVSQTSRSEGRRRTYMIADGPTGADAENAEAQDTSFPQKVAEEGTLVTIELSTASDPLDRNRILNCIANEEVSLDVPPLHHVNYDHYNEVLRKKFAAIVLRVATANGDCDGVRRALHRAPTSHLVWHNAHGFSQLDVARQLASKNPEDTARQEIVEYMEKSPTSLSAILPLSPRVFAAPVAAAAVNVNQPLYEDEAEEDDDTSESDGFVTAAPSNSMQHRSSVCSQRSQVSNSSLLGRFLEQCNNRSRRPSRVGDNLFGDNHSVASVVPSIASSYTVTESSSQRPRRNRRCHSEPQVDTTLVACRESGQSHGPRGPRYPGSALRPGAHHHNEQLHVTGNGGDSGHSVYSSAQNSTCGSDYGEAAGVGSEGLGRQFHGGSLNGGGPEGRQAAVGSLNGGGSQGPQVAGRSLNGSAASLKGVDLIEQMVEAVLMTNVEADALVQSLCTLGNLAAVHADFQDKACAAGALHAVLTSMKGPHGQVGVQREACHALWSLIFNNKQHAKEAIHQGAEHTVKKALQKYPQDIKLLQEGRRALGEMALVRARDEHLPAESPPGLERKWSVQSSSDHWSIGSFENCVKVVDGNTTAAREVCQKNFPPSLAEPLERKGSDESEKNGSNETRISVAAIPSSVSSSSEDLGGVNAAEIPGYMSGGESPVAPSSPSHKQSAPEETTQKAGAHAEQQNASDREDIVGKGVILLKGLPNSEAMLSRKRFRATSMDLDAQAESASPAQQQVLDSMLDFQKQIQSLASSKRTSKNGSDSVFSAVTPSRFKSMEQEVGTNHWSLRGSLSAVSPIGAPMRQEKPAQDSKQVVSDAIAKLSVMVQSSELS